MKLNMWPQQELVEAYTAEGVATGRPRLLLSAAVSAGKGTIDAAYEIAEISKCVFKKFTKYFVSNPSYSLAKIMF